MYWLAFLLLSSSGLDSGFCIREILCLKSKFTSTVEPKRQINKMTFQSTLLEPACYQLCRYCQCYTDSITHSITSHKVVVELEMTSDFHLPSI